MKTTWNFLVLAVMFILQSTACNGGDKVMKIKDLPQAAQTLLKEHFDDRKVSLVQKDADTFRTNYDVVLNDGTKIEFDSKGNWTAIDTKPQAVPEALIPAAINDYVKKTYPEVRIVELKRERSRYEVDLSNNLELKFNKNFKLLKIDD